MYVFYIRLQEREGFLLVPGPHGGIEGFASFALLRRSPAAEDVTDGVRGRAKSVGTQVKSQSISPIVNLVPGLEDLVLDLSRSLSWRVVRKVRAISQARDTLCLVMPNPLSDHLPRRAPATSCFADAARLVVRGHEPQSRLCLGHSVNFPVGQVRHNSCSFWHRCFHHPFAREAPDLATCGLGHDLVTICWLKHYGGHRKTGFVILSRRVAKANNLCFVRLRLFACAQSDNDGSSEFFETLALRAIDRSAFVCCYVSVGIRRSWRTTSTTTTSTTATSTTTASTTATSITTASTTATSTTATSATTASIATA